MFRIIRHFKLSNKLKKIRLYEVFRVRPGELEEMIRGGLRKGTQVRGDTWVATL